MEAVGEFVPDEAGRPRSGMPVRFRQQAAVPGAAADSVDGAVAVAVALLRASAETAAEDVARLDFFEASDFAEGVEDLSRVVEYLQIIGAARVDRTRRDAAAVEKAPGGWGSEPAARSAGGWLTGWNQEPGTGETGGDAKPGDESDGVNGAGAEGGAAPHGSPAGPWGTSGAAVSALAAAAVADDGYRNSAEFLRARLRISAPEAKRRLSLGGGLLPRTGIAGRSLPPARQELAAAVAEGTIASRTATLIAMSLDRVGRVAPPEAVDGMEHALTMTAAENDPDFLARVARRWVEALDQDGTEPSEESLRRLQGVFIRKPRHGLHHLEIFATTDQFEDLATVMNVATNPRLGATANPGAAGDAAATANDGAGAAANARAAADDGAAAAGNGTDPVEARLDRRTRPQKLLDGLVGGCKAALASGHLSAAGGLRPQIMATINYRDLLEGLDASEPQTNQTQANQSWASGASGTAAHSTGGAGSLVFTGPVTASTVRKIACDAEIIPVLLGGEGRVLDIGRASRVFPPHIRKAITARDQGCSFPQCTIPAPWCEAHHVTYWSRGGSTGTDNGTLLCSHHHHLIHKEQWTIQMRSGIPWFIPPPHVDPGQTPRRNRYFRLD
ncbi:HNH endonuclease signature motif containing protein [Arthrobacter sp. ov118]|uniref:HNH endonuclease signature motif containing protein n=1 Tax=Arthrobacter sp. ov118 TaxID=1761747 RepID=UPI0008F140E4|nr:HNH endonuclease signature motif containing protein [Arthrobacter sp. ov118]SFU05875.1 protein of unknown function [Arthrobacter sp. ov118]